MTQQSYLVSITTKYKVIFKTNIEKLSHIYKKLNHTSETSYHQLHQSHQPQHFQILHLTPPMQTMKIVVHTLGCKVNQYESSQVIDELNKLGHTATDQMQKADAYIINTCSVTAEAERKSRQICRRAKSLNDSANVFAFGCAVENYTKQTNNPFFADAIIITGCSDKQQVAQKMLAMYQMDNDSIDNTVDKIDVEPHPKDFGTHRTRKYIKIQDGCNKFCSYCIIPYLRGRNKSRDINDILQEIKNTQANEIILTGIDISSFGMDNGTSLLELFQQINTTARIRFGSIECSPLTAELLHFMKSQGNYCDHFHLSLQSATNSVLKSMNRRYSIEEFTEKVQLIRQIFGQNTGITTDIITGYPTETEQDFATTLANLEKLQFADIHIFRYSPREGTNAFRLPTLPSEIVEKRAKILEQLRAKHKQAFLQRQIGQTLSVYFETQNQNLSKGYSTNYCQVYAPAALHTIQPVKIIDIQEETLVGQIQSNNS